MTETLEMFQEVSGTLIAKPFLGNSEAQELSAVQGQMAVPLTSTNFAALNRAALHGRTAESESKPGSLPGNPSNDPENPRYGSAVDTRVVVAPRELQGSGGGAETVRRSFSPSVPSVELERWNQGAPLISPSAQQLVRVRELMRDGKWRTLSEIADVTGDPEASVSARLRDLRRPKYGLWTVTRKRAGSLYLYCLGGKGI